MVTPKPQPTPDYWAVICGRIIQWAELPTSPKGKPSPKAKPPRPAGPQEQTREAARE